MKKILKLSIAALSALSLVSVSKANESLKVSADSKKEIQAFAHYEFNDVNNFGKDSSVNNFDLITSVSSASEEACVMKDDGEDKYLQIRRDQYSATGVSKNTGAILYAPQLGSTSYDYTDMVSGSYTVSFTFRADNTFGLGDVYALSFGRYGSCLTVVPWANGLEVQCNNIDTAPGDTADEKQQYQEANRTVINSISTADWTQLTVVGDEDTNTMYLYINGELKEQYHTNGIKLTASATDDYTLCVGGQCNIYGGSWQQLGNVDVKDLAIYDCAFSDANVQAYYTEGKAYVEDQGSDVKYVTGLQEFDSSSVDLGLTDVNSVDSLIASLPAKLKVKFNNGVERQMPVYWYAGANNKIKGYLQAGACNPDQLSISMDCYYTVNFDYDSDVISVKNIQLDGKDYVPGTPISSNKQLLTFEIEGGDYVDINSVSYFEMEWDVDDDGVYYIDIAEGALIQIDAATKKFTITYMDGEEKISTQKYTYNGNEQLKAFEKDGYTFAGWYSDAALTTKFEALDYSKPVDVTLYAKYVKNEEKKADEPSADDGKKTEEKSGCGSAAIPSMVGLLAVAGALILSKKRK